MKRTPNSPELAPLLAFGAHPDDIEFACGGVVPNETRVGRSAHFVVCSGGEAASHGTAKVRAIEAEKSAKILGATLEFVELDGDARLEFRACPARHQAGGNDPHASRPRGIVLALQAWSRISIPTTRSWAAWCAMPLVWPGMAVSRN